MIFITGSPLNSFSFFQPKINLAGRHCENLFCNLHTHLDADKKSDTDELVVVTDRNFSKIYRVGVSGSKNITLGHEGKKE